MDWLFSMDDPLLTTMAGSLLVFLVVILLTRLIGLRSFAKFTAYDFAVTIAIGSIISSTLTSATSVAQGSVAIASLLFLTYLFSTAQKRWPAVKSLISNDPLLLMKGDTILEDNLVRSRIDRSQLLAKLREANVSSLDQVQAVVLESTGDISVLHKPSGSVDKRLDPELLDGVRETT